MSPEHESHGHTPAAWTCVTVIFLGSCVSGAAVIAALPWLFFVGLGVIVIGVIVGKVMQMMGLGALPPTPNGSPALHRESARAEQVHDANAASSSD
jgi:hypothetical protein